MNAPNALPQIRPTRKPSTVIDSNTNAHNHRRHHGRRTDRLILLSVWSWFIGLRIFPLLGVLLRGFGFLRLLDLVGSGLAWPAWFGWGLLGWLLG